MPVCEWIDCLTGSRGKIDAFPAEIFSSGGLPGVVLRISSSDGSVEICPDFRGREVFLNGKSLLAPTAMEPDVPAMLLMAGTLLALCSVHAGGWADEYRFPLWTIFESETFDPIETVRDPSDIPAALARNGVRAGESVISPYGLPLVIAPEHVAGILFR